ncbi:type VI secretion system-associated FHA domain protein [Thaumasiovibrio subtropicus]|uniref:type VI secretion system-associated FHA domain protein n=1 Tax=Thaumasiovibrio subtropicus TaxID=1891207 RepID=UPI000B363702|nr:FHA domain-containing protein [Thaumasiovibrio subtropicus]
MPISLRIISSPDGESISEWNKQFPEDGGAIGRSYGSTLQLSDGTREVSGTHAVIKKSSRGYQIIDNSTNGLFINGANKPLGKGNQTTLSDGDVLDLGRYRLLVSCFVPEQAVARNSAAVQSGQSSFDDDPFAAPQHNRQPSPNSAGPAVREEKFEPTISGFEVVDDDPFIDSQPVEPVREQATVTPIRDFDDDPFEVDGEDELPTFFASPEPTEMKVKARPEPDTSARFKPEPQVATAYEPERPAQAPRPIVEYRSPEVVQQMYIDKAIEMALARLISDIDPVALEAMFNELVSPGYFSRRPKYWDMYKRYFKRQVSSKELQLKFHAYFQDSLKVQRTLGEK